MKCTLESIFWKCQDGRYLDHQDEHTEIKLLNEIRFLVTKLTLQLNIFLCKTIYLQFHSASSSGSCSEWNTNGCRKTVSGNYVLRSSATQRGKLLRCYFIPSEFILIATNGVSSFFVTFQTRSDVVPCVVLNMFNTIPSDKGRCCSWHCSRGWVLKMEQRIKRVVFELWWGKPLDGTGLMKWLKSQKLLHKSVYFFYTKPDEDECKRIKVCVWS